MKLSAICLASLLALLPACDDDDDSSGVDFDAGEPDAGPDASGELLDQLRGLPGVVSVMEYEVNVDGYRGFDIQFEQPVDHDNPEGATFVQRLALMHTDAASPTILFTSGYGLSGRTRRTELVRYLHGNQLSVEHRYFDPSRPDPADWTFLNVHLSAADFHAITQSFKTILTGAWVGNGASKGGMTSVYHRRFYPDDLDGTVAYVAPHSQSAADPRYDVFLDEVIPADCMADLRAAQVDMVDNRRAMLEEDALARAQGFDFHFDLLGVDAAVEQAVVELEFGFFQYYGISQCDAIPTTQSDDGTVATFLDDFSSSLNFADESNVFYAPYYYQAYSELGYPAAAHPHLNGKLLFGPEDYAGIFPLGVTVPAYDGATMLDVGSWVKSDAEDIIFVYGEFDPWTAAAFDIGDNTKVSLYTVPDGTHSANITRLPDAERSAALAELGAWTGVTPIEPLPVDPQPMKPDTRWSPREGLRR